MDTKHAKCPIYVINVELIAALIRESMFSQGWTIKDLCQILCLNSCTTPCTYTVIIFQVEVLKDFMKHYCGV